MINLIEASKQKYYCGMSSKLIIAERSSKAYWSILKRFLNNNACKLPSNFTLYTNNRLSTVNFYHEDISKIIQNLNPNKAYDHDNIGIGMLKI